MSPLSVSASASLPTFFFFQAEDGILDADVTGVQTCALPISERERISLGVKQLESDPFSEFVAENDKGTLVTGKVIAVEAKSATVEIAPGVEATLKASEKIGRASCRERV